MKRPLRFLSLLGLAGLLLDPLATAQTSSGRTAAPGMPSVTPPNAPGRPIQSPPNAPGLPLVTPPSAPGLPSTTAPPRRGCLPIPTIRTAP